MVTPRIAQEVLIDPAMMDKAVSEHIESGAQCREAFARLQAYRQAASAVFEVALNANFPDEHFAGWKRAYRELRENIDLQVAHVVILKTNHRGRSDRQLWPAKGCPENCPMYGLEINKYGQNGRE